MLHDFNYWVSCLPLSISASLNFSPLLCLSFSLFLSLFLSISLSPSLSSSLSFSLFLSLFYTLCLLLSIYLSLSFSLSLTQLLSLPSYLSLCRYNELTEFWIASFGTKQILTVDAFCAAFAAHLKDCTYKIFRTFLIFLELTLFPSASHFLLKYSSRSSVFLFLSPLLEIFFSYIRCISSLPSTLLLFFLSFFRTYFVIFSLLCSALSFATFFFSLPFLSNTVATTSETPASEIDETVSLFSAALIAYENEKRMNTESIDGKTMVRTCSHVHQKIFVWTDVCGISLKILHIWFFCLSS